MPHPIDKGHCKLEACFGSGFGPVAQRFSAGSRPGGGSKLVGMTFFIALGGDVFPRISRSLQRPGASRPRRLLKSNWPRVVAIVGGSRFEPKRFFG